MEFAVARAYGNIQQILEQTASTRAAAGDLRREREDKRNESTGDSVTVSLSAAALQAAEMAGAATAARDFAPEIIREAQIRLSERRSAPAGGYLPAMIAGLPLLPENQALLDRMHREMRELREQGNDPVAQARYNQLASLATCLQVQGWQQPLSEADLQHEVDVSDAMAQLDNAATTATLVDRASALDPLSGWRQRWRQDERNLPALHAGSRSPWLEMAAAAGIGADAFLSGARQLAVGRRGEALTSAVEDWLAQSYAPSPTAAASPAL